jgi:transcriptional regulator with XRE-family HTH domain
MPYTRLQRAVLREFGKRVRRAREVRGWTQEDLADEAGLDRTYIGGIERGERNLALLNVNKLAVALGDGFTGFLPCHPGRRAK